MPGGKTIAHGFLTLSLVPRLGQTIYRVKHRSRGLNYGSNRVRFTGQVQAGSRIRLRQKIKSVEPVEGGVRITSENTVEVEGPRPALVAKPSACSSIDRGGLFDGSGSRAAEVRVRPTGAASAPISRCRPCGLYPRRSSARSNKRGPILCCVPHQRLDDEQLKRFSAHFGELDWAPVIAASRVKGRGEGRYVDSAEGGANASQSAVIRTRRSVRWVLTGDLAPTCRTIGTALRQRAACPRSATLGRRHRLCQYVPQRTIPGVCDVGRGRSSAGTHAQPRQRRQTARVCLSNRSAAGPGADRDHRPIRLPGARRFSRAPTQCAHQGLALEESEQLSKRCGRMPPFGAFGTSSSESATSSCGTTVARCTAATNSTPTAGG
jgi:hypothetical protein